MSRTTQRTAITAILGTLAVLFVGGLVFMYSGAYNVAATNDDSPFIRWVLATVQDRSVEARADDVAEPPPLTAAMVDEGFTHFHEMCELCHGGPGVERGEPGKGITPTPPDLAEEGEEWSARELFWITKHGIKLAGMPAFGVTHDDHEIWEMVAFVQQLPGMSAREYRRRIEQFEAAGGLSHTHAEETGAEAAPATR